ncbi:MAG: hypothetical protein M1831_001434 [Alyxoria varia]|nr:MAG: hypothetical protein M1831_001434 [Alyxoria varia]
MLGIKISLVVAVGAALTAAAPAPGFDKVIRAEATPTGAAEPSATRTGGLASQVAASDVPSMSAYDLVSSQVTGPTSHGPYEGTPTTTGAPQSGPAATILPDLGPAPTATYYNANGELTEEEPLPYTPAGGLGTNGTTPRYMVNSDFDFYSIALGLYQEWIELDLFHNGLARFSEEDFKNAGLTAEDRTYIEFMANQETGHATLLTNMLGEAAPPQCTYDYPFTNVREFIDFNLRLTRWGESGVWGFINHLDSREVGQLLAQSIATEARQEMSFRQMMGLHPQPVWFETGIPQSWSWTYLAPYISSCPQNTTRLPWQNFPTLHIVNNANLNRVSPNDTEDYEVTGRRIGDPSTTDIPEDAKCLNADGIGDNCSPAIVHNKSEPLSFPGKEIRFEWETPGLPVGPNNSYVTSSSAGKPSYVAWVSQLNLTYTDLITTGDSSGYTYQPEGFVYEGEGAVNDTMFVAITDSNPYLTPFNLSSINTHVNALGLFAAG